MKLKLIACPSPNFEDRKDKIQFIIIHATGCKDIQETFSYLIDSVAPSRVSSHFVIDRDGTVYGLVDPEKRAFHAGISNWQGYCERTGFKGLNDASIGIELQSSALKKMENGEVCEFDSFTPEQMNACEELCKRLMKIYNISADNVLRHSDVAPLRKYDPGKNFAWDEFKKALSSLT